MTNIAIEKWVKTWKNAAQSLKSIKINELQSKNYYSNNLKFIDEMLQYASDKAEIKFSSGLVEQQRLFMIFRDTYLIIQGKK